MHDAKRGGGGRVSVTMTLIFFKIVRMCPLRKHDWGGRHKILPYSDNGLLKVVIIFYYTMQHLSMAAYIFPQT